jgi:hypothetical protein
MDSASAFLRFYAELIRQPGETASEARERARRDLPTVAALAAAETLRRVRAI